MPRPSQLSPDNILRFLQVRSAPASTDEIAAALHMSKADRHALYKMLSKLKKRRAIEELPGGRYRLASRREKPTGDGHPPRGTAREAGGTRAAGADARPTTARESGGIASRNEITGRLVLHHDGYGFVVPDPPVPLLDRYVFIRRGAHRARHRDSGAARRTWRRHRNYYSQAPSPARVSRGSDEGGGAARVAGERSGAGGTRGFPALADRHD